MTKRSEGFSLIEIVAALVLLMVAGFGGWYIWHKNQKDGTGKQPNAAAQNTGNTVGAHDPSEGGKYLVIKEWGVRFALPQSLRGDVKYGIHNKVNEAVDSRATEPHYISAAYFTSAKLSAKGGSSNTCKIEEDPDNPGNYQGGPVALLRSSTRIQPYQDGDVLIDRYWYQPRNGNGGVCYPQSDGTEEGAFSQSMIAALKTMKAIPKK